MNEPIGWIYEDDEGRMMFSQMPQNPPLWEPVYRAREQWKGLTDEEIDQAAWPHFIGNALPSVKLIVRQLEDKLKEKNA